MLLKNHLLLSTEGPITAHRYHMDSKHRPIPLLTVDGPRTDVKVHLISGMQDMVSFSFEGYEDRYTFSQETRFPHHTGPSYSIGDHFTTIEGDVLIIRKQSIYEAKYPSWGYLVESPVPFYFRMKHGGTLVLHM